MGKKPTYTPEVAAKRAAIKKKYREEWTELCNEMARSMKLLTKKFNNITAKLEKELADTQ
jgi:hypothetical protein